MKTGRVHIFFSKDLYQLAHTSLLRSEIEPTESAVRETMRFWMEQGAWRYGTQVAEQQRAKIAAARRQPKCDGKPDCGHCLTLFLSANPPVNGC